MRISVTNRFVATLWLIATEPFLRMKILLNAFCYCSLVSHTDGPPDVCRADGMTIRIMKKKRSSARQTVIP
jgi:hypothetical protein